MQLGPLDTVPDVDEENDDHESQQDQEGHLDPELLGACQDAPEQGRSSSSSSMPSTSTQPLVQARQQHELDEPHESPDELGPSEDELLSMLDGDGCRDDDDKNSAQPHREPPHMREFAARLLQDFMAERPLLANRTCASHPQQRLLSLNMVCIELSAHFRWCDLLTEARLIDEEGWCDLATEGLVTDILECLERPKAKRI